MVRRSGDTFGDVLVAEFAIFLSRPVAPTRRIALGSLDADAGSPHAAILLGAVAAARIVDVDPDLRPDIVRLTRQLEAGERIPQPRLRHRLQQDRVGLTSHRHRLLGGFEGLRLDLDDRGHPAPHVLGAVYAAGRLPGERRPKVFSAIRRGLRWRGGVDSKLIAYLAGDRMLDLSVLAGEEPRVWALSQLGLEGQDVEAAMVQRRFRELVRAAHPDQGGRAEDAASRIDALARARHILLTG